MNTLECFIDKFYQRMTGVPITTRTKEFIHQELDKTREEFDRSTRSLHADVMIFSFDFYSVSVNIRQFCLTIRSRFFSQTDLESLFLPIKFLSTQPFLSLMYHDEYDK